MDTPWLGTVPYTEALERQRAYRTRVVEGQAPEALWGLEHPPVITLGKRGGEVRREAVAAAGFEVVQTERGGFATCHEPGQLVGYLFVRAGEIGVRRLVAALEHGIASALGEWGLAAAAREGFPGVWVGNQKVCAVGLHVSRGVTMHGFALNLGNDLRGFDLIVPCGIRDGGVATVTALSGSTKVPADCWGHVSRHVAASIEAARGLRP